MTAIGMTSATATSAQSSPNTGQRHLPSGVIGAWRAPLLWRRWYDVERRVRDSPESTASVTTTSTSPSTAAVERSSEARYCTKMALVKLSKRSIDRKSVVAGKRVYVRVTLGGGRNIKKKKKN